MALAVDKIQSGAAAARSAKVNEAHHLFFVYGRDEDETQRDELIAQLLNDGLHPCCLSGSSTGVDAVEQLARELIEVIRQRQPSGPYCLVGTASAGPVVYEAAFKLIGEDEVVEFLGIIDSSARDGANADARSLSGYEPHPLPVVLHLFATEQNRARLQREWAAVAGSRLSIRTIAAPEPSQPEPSFAHGVARAVQSARQAARTRPVPSNPEYLPALTIQTGAHGSAPVYCVPGAGANITSFMTLAQGLGQATTVVGLQPRGMDQGLVPHASVTAAARNYVREIMKIDRRGAYRLLGHSFGGWVVFEMSRLLIEGGQKIDSLVLIDSQPPTVSKPARHYGRVDVLMKLMQIMEQASERSFSLTRAELEQLSHEAQLARFMERMKAVGLLPAAARLDAIRSLVRVFSVNINTVYAPQFRFPGELLLVQAADPCNACNAPDPDDLDDDRAAESWAGHASSVTRVKSPGNHMTMLKSPNVEALAGHVRAFLGRMR